MSFMVINSTDSFKFIQALYKEEVLSYMETNPIVALAERSYMITLIRVGKDIYCDFWGILKEELGENFAVEIKQKYESEKGKD